MQRKIHITATRNVDDAVTLFVTGARYQGSEPFPGHFQIVDSDLCLSFNAETKKQIALVYCHIANGQDQDDMIEIEFDDLVINISEGYTGEVVDRIDFAD